MVLFIACNLCTFAMIGVGRWAYRFSPCGFPGSGTIVSGWMKRPMAGSGPLPPPYKRRHAPGSLPLCFLSFPRWQISNCSGIKSAVVRRSNPPGAKPPGYVRAKPPRRGLLEAAASAEFRTLQEFGTLYPGRFQRPSPRCSTGSLALCGPHPTAGWCSDGR